MFKFFAGWNLVQKLVLGVFIVLALFVTIRTAQIVGDSVENIALDNTSRVLTFIGLLVGLGSGLLGITTAYKNDETGQITPWGWCAILGVSMGFLISMINTVVDNQLSDKKSDDLLDALREMINEAVSPSFNNPSQNDIPSQNEPILFLRFDINDGFLPSDYQERLLAQEDQFGIDTDELRSGYFATSCALNFPQFGDESLDELHEMFDEAEILVGLGDETVREQIVSLPERSSFSNQLMEQALEGPFNGYYVHTFMAQSLSSHRDACLNGILSSYYQIGYNGDEHLIIINQQLPEFSYWQPAPRFRSDPSDTLYLIVASTLFRDIDNIPSFSEWRLNYAEIRGVKTEEEGEEGLSNFCMSTGAEQMTFGQDAGILLISVSQDNCRW